ncbi:MAG: hypothetical protein IMX00_05880 [Limnochordales bacterium]|nr:hypothetical protein [Limnochordales bacterium]
MKTRLMPVILTGLTAFFMLVLTGSAALAAETPALSTEAARMGENPVILIGFEPDEPIFLAGVNGGEVKDYVVVSDDRQQGEGAGMITFDVSDPTQSWSGARVGRAFSPALSIPGYRKLGLWIKGDGLKHSVIVGFHDGVYDGSVWFDFEHAGWQHFVVDFGSFANQWQLDRLDWSHITRVFIEFADGAGTLKNKGTVVLDELVLAK